VPEDPLADLCSSIVSQKHMMTFTRPINAGIPSSLLRHGHSPRKCTSHRNHTPIPVLALGKLSTGPARTPHGALVAANPSGRVSAPGGRTTWSLRLLPANRLGSERLRHFEAFATFRYPSLQRAANGVMLSKNRVRKVQESVCKRQKAHKIVDHPPKSQGNPRKAERETSASWVFQRTPSASGITM